MLKTFIDATAGQSTDEITASGLRDASALPLPGQVRIIFDDRLSPLDLFTTLTKARDALGKLRDR
jgi:hypothetical protein